MWARLFTPTLPTPLHTEDVRRNNVRGQLLDEIESDARPPSPEKHAHYSIRPIFDKYKLRKSNANDPRIHQLRDRRCNRTSPSPAPESPMIRNLKRDYAALRVTLHSNGAKNAAKIGESLAIDVEEKVKANISKLNKVASKERELSVPFLDCEVDTELNNKYGQKRAGIEHARKAVSRYQEIEAERIQQLTHLWGSWEKAQTDINELVDKLHELFAREPFNGRSGISSNGEWTDKEDFDIDRRIKQVVEDMTACEEEFQEKLKSEETDIFEATLKSSLD